MNKKLKIKAIVDGLIKKSGESPPINVQNIAEQLGVTVVFDSAPIDVEVSGFLFVEGKKKLIGVNSSHSLTRQRFTIAHELGHLLLHCRQMSFPHFDKQLLKFRDSNSTLGVDIEEIEANRFAAELLLPETILREAIEKVVEQNLDDAALTELENLFCVSRQALIVRLSNLGLITI